MAEIIWAVWGSDLMNLCNSIFNANQKFSYNDASSLEDEWGYAVDTVAKADVGEVAFQLLDKLVLQSRGSLVVKPMMLDTGNGFKAGLTFGDVARVGNIYEVSVKGLFTQAPFIDVFGALTNAAGYDVEANKLAQLGADVLSDILNKEVTPAETAQYKVNVYAEKNPNGGGGGGGSDEDNEIITHINEEVAQTILNSMASRGYFVGTEITQELNTNIHAVDVDTPEIPNISALFRTVAMEHMVGCSVAGASNNQSQFNVDCINAFQQQIIPTLELTDGIMGFRILYDFDSTPYSKMYIAMAYIPTYTAIMYGGGTNVNTMYFYIDKEEAYGTLIKDTYRIYRKDNGQIYTPSYDYVYEITSALLETRPKVYYGQIFRLWELGYDANRDVIITEISDNSVKINQNSAAARLYFVAGLECIAQSNMMVETAISNAFNTLISNDDFVAQTTSKPATQDSHDIDNWGSWLPKVYHGIDEQTGDATVVQHIPIDITNTKDVADTLSVPQEIAQAGVSAIPMGLSYADSIAVPGTIDWLREMGYIVVPSIADKDKAITIADEGAPTPTPTPIVPVLPPDISAQRLYTVHSVNQQEINNLGAYLWSTDFISLITNMFNAPIDAVIGLHTLYYGGSLPLGSNEIIKLGAVLAQSETVTCTGTRVTNQFMKFECGSVAIPEYYGNVEDYAGYSKCEIFLPFIGFRELDINEIMGGSVFVKYGIDIFTGACVATVGVMRDGVSNALYAFEGNCAIQQPVTSADYSRLISGIISAGVAIAAGAASGGAGAAIGAASLLTGHKVTYPRSGGLTANAGACLQKQPYIIIKRPKAFDASNYSAFYGNVTNWTVTLGQCHGYTRVKDVHIDSVACTDAEKDEILALLKSGVIL